jgi:hypothetical protein
LVPVECLGADHDAFLLLKDSPLPSNKRTQPQTNGISRNLGESQAEAGRLPDRNVQPGQKMHHRRKLRIFFLLFCSLFRREPGNGRE